MINDTVGTFIETAKNIGATVISMPELKECAAYITGKSKGTILVPSTPLTSRHQLKNILQSCNGDVFAGNFRDAGQVPAAGVTFCNFALADSGTVVLESTAEDIRLATMLPEIHFILVDPATILEDNLAATDIMTRLHQGSEPLFIAYITGPSRTADIERVLTIGCHGPRELHLLIVENISSDPMEN